MTTYILRRFLYLIPTFFGATFLAFLIIQLAPGDYITQFELDPRFTPETIARFRAQFGLDRPVHEQYLLWMHNLLHLNLGYSFAYQAPVLEVVWPRVVNSMIIVIPATVLLFLVAIPVGVYGALRQYSLGDRVVSFLAYVGLAIPNFFLALIFMYLILQVYFRTGVMVFPVSGMTSTGFEQFPTWQKILNVAWHAVIPVIVVTTSDIAGFSRVMRGQMLEVLSQDYIRTARAKGLAERMVVYKHALRNAVIPFVANIGAILPGLISGAGLVEVVMAWPGITPLLLDSLRQQDLYTVAGFLTMGLVLLMIGNLLSDLLLTWVDPRIRYE
ncbi:ABC transporter permease [Thermus thermamylovorans]|uniref:ABC transporter permease n=1 Tax=Thermus thermamylovorans TaxID=2509362 RepID=A0A4Q9B3T2_9DEIN|nr:ABC transporter permease [Thermus thermamylovorans]TBH20204.1 ABC transporter permease [Thermus thermamylovorans]